MNFLEKRMNYEQSQECTTYIRRAGQQFMRLYHGTSMDNLKTLKPHISEHKEPYVYFSTNPVVASFYMIHIVERPYNWFPYGFNKDGIPFYTEYYPNAMEDVYGNKTGYLYVCDDVLNTDNPTNINCAYTCPEAVNITNCIVFDNIYEQFTEWEQQGKLVIKKYEMISEKEMEFIRNYFIELIIKDNLKDKPDISQSVFIMKNFHGIWSSCNPR